MSSIGWFKRMMRTYGNEAVVDDLSLTNAKISATAGIVPSKLAVANGNIIIGDAGGQGGSVAQTGDVTFSSTGVAAITAGAIVNADINASAAIAGSKIADLGVTNGKLAGNIDPAKITLSSGKILVGNASNSAAEQTSSGDVTFGSTGVASITADSIVNADINSAAAIVGSKLSATANIAGTQLAAAAAIAATQLETLGASTLIMGNTAGDGNVKFTLTGDVTIAGDTGVVTIANDAVTAAKIADAAAIAVTQLEGIAAGKILVGVDGTGANNALVSVSGDATLINDGTITLNAAHQEQIIMIPIENLAADADIDDRPVFVHPRACTLVSIGVLAQGAPAGIAAGNEGTITIMDDASNIIVTKIYDGAPDFPTNDYDDLGALDGTHKVLAAGEHLLLDVDSKNACDLPAFVIVVTLIPTNA